MKLRKARGLTGQVTSIAASAATHAWPQKKGPPLYTTAWMKVVDTLLTLADMEINADIRLSTTCSSPAHHLLITLLLRRKKQDVVERALEIHHKFITKWFEIETATLSKAGRANNRANKRKRISDSI
jgi:hypothetical protein